MPAKNTGPIRVAVLGQGRSGLDIHCRWFSRAPRQYRLVAVADLLAERRRRARQELGCDAYADYGRVLEREDVELVVNALPSHLHPRITVEALEAGHHVVCEKPLAWSVAELDKMIQAARQHRRRLLPFQQSRYAPHFQKMLQVIDSGVLGHIVQVSISYSGFARRWDWQTLQEFKGGNLLNTGPHALDQAMRLLGFKKPDQVLCALDRANTFGDAEDYVKVLLRTRNRPVIDLEISSCNAYPHESFTVHGTLGGLKGGAAGLSWRYYHPAKAPGQKLIRTPLPGPSYCRENLKLVEKTWKPSQQQQNSFAYMSKCYYDQVYKVLRQGASPEITPQQVRVQIRVIEECHRQNRLSKLPRRGWPKGD
jgi:predicted dehydrogenase